MLDDDDDDDDSMPNDNYDKSTVCINVTAHGEGQKMLVNHWYTVFLGMVSGASYTLGHSHCETHTV